MPKRSVTIRMEESDYEQLEAIAREQRQMTGDKTGVSDVIREAVAKYIENQIDSGSRND
ncbi:ribbon-helix-helix protein, CopG family [Halomonas hibernica]|uniref:ribbon-helix-helix protein, CopG family n=1 Tax=Halomonas hibernica TaxID=2591147 RepID=UPI00155681AD|nr:ribbon-helix-helix protein, CopG family [Halomonas hibernica]